MVIDIETAVITPEKFWKDFSKALREDCQKDPNNHFKTVPLHVGFIGLFFGDWCVSVVNNKRRFQFFWKESENIRKFQGKKNQVVKHSFTYVFNKLDLANLSRLKAQIRNHEVYFYIRDNGRKITFALSENVLKKTPADLVIQLGEDGKITKIDNRSNL